MARFPSVKRWNWDKPGETVYSSHGWDAARHSRSGSRHGPPSAGLIGTYLIISRINFR
jgi:hypothetical protein